MTAGVPVGASPATGIDTDLNAKGKVLTGFRVPCIIASPFTRVDQPADGGHPQLLRPHLGPEADRVALGTQAAHPTRCLERAE